MSVEMIASDKVRYIRVAAIDIVSSEGIRNIYFMKRCEKPVIVPNKDIRYSVRLTFKRNEDQHASLINQGK